MPQIEPLQALVPENRGKQNLKPDVLWDNNDFSFFKWEHKI